jgi:hypothetical protein
MWDGYKPTQKTLEPIEVARFIPGRLLRDTRIGFGLHPLAGIIAASGKDAMRLQESTQLRDGLVHLTTQVPQQQVCWHPFSNAGLVNRYLEGKAHVLVFFQCGKSAEFVACLSCPDRWVLRGEQHLTKEDGGASDDDRLSSVEESFLAWKHASGHRDGADSEQHPVLVADVELMQLPCPMPETTLVRLDIVESIERVLPKAWYFSARHLTVRFGGIENWEARLRVGIFGTSFHEGNSKMIQRASEIMKSIPQHERKACRDDRNRLDVIDVLSRLHIVLTPDGVGIGEPEGIDSSLEITDVLLGPIVFC